MEIKRLELGKEPKGYKLYLDLFDDIGAVTIGKAKGDISIGSLTGENLDTYEGYLGFRGYLITGIDDQQITATHYIDLPKGFIKNLKSHILEQLDPLTDANRKYLKKILDKKDKQNVRNNI